MHPLLAVTTCEDSLMSHLSHDAPPSRSARGVGPGRRAARPAPSVRWTALLLAVPLGGLLSGALVWQASYAAFTATTTNAGNSWTAGTVALTDDDASSAMFTASDLEPGSTGQRCIAVTYNGTLASAVELYIKPGELTGDTTLDDHVDLVVTEGTGGGFGSCTGFVAGATAFTGDLASFAGAHTSFATGAGAWAPTGAGQARTYRFTYTLAADAPDTVQGKTVGATFTWEAQNT